MVIGVKSVMMNVAAAKSEDNENENGNDEENNDNRRHPCAPYATLSGVNGVTAKMACWRVASGAGMAMAKAENENGLALPPPLTHLPPANACPSPYVASCPAYQQPLPTTFTISTAASSISMA